MADTDQTGSDTQIVGRYEILREIGRGGMAIVYAARQPDLDRQVALKELSRFHAGSAEYAHRFLRESRLAGSLNHPNIVTVHEYFEHAGTPYIAMEYVPRGSLRPYMKSLSLNQIAGLLEGVLAGLAHAETAGIVHRDLKPENIMVTADGRVKITDFGIARATQRAGTQYMTATGMTVGTPTYMAPEQAMAGAIGPWSDLYSVGVLTYELLVGQPPFHDTDTPMVILMRHVNERIPSPIEVRPDLDPRLSQWIDSLLVKNPEERVRHALVAWESLEDILVALLGPLWRRDARLLENHLAVIEAEPLTPAPFESHVSLVTPTPQSTAAVPDEFVTFEPRRAPLAPDGAAAPAPAPQTPEEPRAPGPVEPAPDPAAPVAAPEPLAPVPGEPAPATPDPEPGSFPGQREPQSDSREPEFVTFAPVPSPSLGVRAPEPEAPASPLEPATEPEAELVTAASPEPVTPPAPPEPVTPPPEPVTPAPPSEPSAGRAAEPEPELIRAGTPLPTPEPPIARPAAQPRARSKAPMAILAAAAGVAAAVIGFVIAPSSRSHVPAVSLKQAATGPVTIRYPARWQHSAGAPSSARGLKLTQPVTLTPGVSAPGGALVLGTATTTESTLPPAGFAGALGSSPQGVPVRLGSLTFERYPTPSQYVYALPTRRGTVIAACILPQANAPAFAATCEGTLKSLTTSAPALPVTANPSYASALGSVMSKLNGARSVDGAKLASARNPPSQASAAAALAQAHSRAATAAAGLTPGPVGAAGNASIVAALHRLATGYTSLATAARHGDGTGYAAARKSIGQAESALSAGFSELRADGYTIG